MLTALCLGPTLLRPEEETVAAIMDIKFANVVVELLIQNWEPLLRTKPDTNPLTMSSVWAVTSPVSSSGASGACRAWGSRACRAWTSADRTPGPA